MVKDKSEEIIAKKLGGKLTHSSGAVMDDADIRIEGFLTEVKHRSGLGNKVVLDPKFWEKLRKQCVKHNKMPLYVYQADEDIYGITYIDSFYWIENKAEQMIKPRIGKTIIFRKDELNSIYSEADSIAVFEWMKIKFVIMPLNVLEEIINGQRKAEEIREN